MRLAGSGNRLADSFQMAAIDREVGLISKPRETRSSSSHEMRSDFLGARFGHLEQVVEMFLVGVVAQVEAGERADLQVFLLAARK